MIGLVSTAKAFGVRPSSFISGIGGYEAYCFDQAATYYLMKLQDGEKPVETYEDATDFLL